MTPPFSVHTTPHFDRLLNARKRAILILPTDSPKSWKTDPHNLSRAHNIQRLEGVRPGEGQYRLRLGRAPLSISLLQFVP